MNIGKLDTVQNVVDCISQDPSSSKIFLLTLSGFEDAYREIHKRHGDTRLDIVINGDWAIVQFSEISNTRIRVVSDNRLSRLALLTNYHLYLEQDDFKICHTTATFYGQTEYLTFWRYIKEEIPTNGLKAVTFFLFSAISLWIIISNSNEPSNVFSSINDVLINVTAIFFSMFLLFAASQNASMMNENLFRRGLSHRFIQVDRKVAYFAVLILAIATMNKAVSAMISSGNSAPIIVSTALTQTNYLLYILVATTALGIAMIGVCLTMIVQYYFKRTQNLFETEYSQKILDSAYSSRNGNNK